MINLKKLSSVIKKGLLEGLDFNDDIISAGIYKKHVINNVIIKEHEYILKQLSENCSMDIDQILQICNQFNLKYQLPNNNKDYIFDFFDKYFREYTPQVNIILNDETGEINADSVLDLNWIDVSNLNSTGAIFSHSPDIIAIDIHTWDFSNCKNLVGLFENCEKLRYVNMSDCKTDTILDVHAMFMGCNNLQYVDMSNINMKNVLRISSMFLGCKNLRTVRNIDKWYMPYLKHMSQPFQNCTKLKCDLSKWLDVSHNKDYYNNVKINKKNTPEIIYAEWMLS